MSLPANVVARVGRHSITRTALAHFTAAEAVLTYEHDPRLPVPSGVVPDPPTYKNCIAYVAKAAHARSAQATLNTTQLRGKCRHEHEALQDQALGVLIGYYWVSEEAVTRGLAVSPREFQQGRSRAAWATRSERSLRAAGVLPSDERVAVESQLLRVKLQRHTLPIYGVLRRSRAPETARMAEQVDIALQGFANELERRWIPRTICRPAFVVYGCREYAVPRSH